MKFSHILLPIDGSKHSDNATAYTIYLANMSHARVTVVSCYEWNTHLHEISQMATDELKDKMQQYASAVVEASGEKLKAAGIDYQVKTVSGAPGTVLSNMAKTGDFDLIVMGSQGHSDIAGLFLGSVTHKVLNKIYCPMLIVP